MNAAWLKGNHLGTHVINLQIAPILTALSSATVPMDFRVMEKLVKVQCVC